MISLIACAGRRVRRASSAWLRPSVSSVSARSSPGGIVMSGQTRVLVAIVLAHLLDPRGGLGLAREGHNQPGSSCQPQRVLPLAVASQTVEPQHRDAMQILDAPTVWRMPIRWTYR